MTEDTIDKLLEAIAAKWPFPTSDEVRGAVSSAHWSNDDWKYDWRSEVPTELWRLWPTLPEEVHLAVYLVCENLFLRQP